MCATRAEHEAGGHALLPELVMRAQAAKHARVRTHCPASGQSWQTPNIGKAREGAYALLRERRGAPGTRVSMQRSRSKSAVAHQARRCRPSRCRQCSPNLRRTSCRRSTAARRRRTLHGANALVPNIGLDGL